MIFYSKVTKREPYFTKKKHQISESGTTSINYFARLIIISALILY